MSRWFAFLIIFGCLAAADGTGSIDSEDVDVFKAMLEEREIQELNISKEQFRLRLIPEPENEAVFYRTLISRSNWQAGLRIDHIPGDDRTQLSKLFFGTKSPNKKILLGNLKIERGQGLVFGNNYGRLNSTTAPLSFTETKTRAGFDLTSYANAGVLGTLIELKSTSLTQGILLGNCPLGIKQSESGESLTISSGSTRTIDGNLAGYLLTGDFEMGQYGVSLVGEHFSKAVGGKHGNIWVSIFAEQNLSQFRIIGEGVLSGNGPAYVLNLTYRSAALSWFLHRRYFSQHYQPLSGSPFADYGGGDNEAGWIAGAKYKSRKITLSTWLGFSNQLAGASGQIRNKGYDRQTYIRLAGFLQGTLELRFRQREKYYRQQRTQNEIEHEYWSFIQRDYTTFTYKRNGKENYKVKVSLVQYRPHIEENETGTLISFIFPEVSWKWFEARYGVHLFHTDGWNSRLYDYEYSLPGEFRLVPFYETGAEAYGVCKIEVNQGVALGMRISYEWKANQNYAHDPDIAIQADIHR
ncbi:MAG: hypothetical protein GXO91_01550 [FCB group bacterium]|nr:hypothetical protein [FCB group bacterium]